MDLLLEKAKCFWYIDKMAITFQVKFENGCQSFNKKKDTQVKQKHLSNKYP
jgi:hypothetical protein